MDSSWGVLPNAFGVVVQPRAADHQTITSYYGLYVEAPDLHNGNGIITNRFGVYVADSSYINYFAGKVGIGTSTLTAAAGLAIKKNGDNLYLEQSNADNGWIIQTLDSSGYLLFERRGEGGSPSNNNRMTITTAGNVGIGGTVAPAQLLTVQGGSDPTIFIRHDSANNADSGKLAFGEADNNEQAWIKYDGSANQVLSLIHI